MLIRAVRTLAPVIALAAVAQTPASAGLLTDWNLVVTGDYYSHSSTEIDGNVRIGGSMNVNQYQVGNHLPSSYAGQNTLVVGGGVVGNVTVHQGNAEIGGAGPNVTATGSGGTVVQNSSAVQGIGAADSAVLLGDSNAFKAMAANNSVALPAGSPAGVTFKATNLDAQGNAVFNIDGNKLFGNSNVQQIDLVAGAAKSIIINVTGTSISFNAGNFVGGFTSLFARAHTIWNFVDATFLDFRNHEFDGAILAPKANLLTGSAPVQGAVFVKSMTSPGQTGEIHMPLYQGFDPQVAAVPEPSTLFGAGFTTAIGLAFARWRKRNAA